MVRLTAELIVTSPAFVNTLKERELDLRGNKIAQIENLGATEDQYDVLDFSDNDITRLEGFPLLNRLSTLFLNNNRITSIATGLGPKIPNLETLILTGNRVEHLADIDPLLEFKKLQTLSLLKNPVTKVKHYRLYVIFKLPSVKVLDFQKVKAKERTEAAKLFDNETGAQLVSSISQVKIIPAVVAVPAHTEEEKQKLQEMITKADTNEEIQRIERALRAGKIPKNIERTRVHEQDLDEDKGKEEDMSLDHTGRSEAVIEQLGVVASVEAEQQQQQNTGDTTQNGISKENGSNT